MPLSKEDRDSNRICFSFLTRESVYLSIVLGCESRIRIFGEADSRFVLSLWLPFFPPLLLDLDGLRVLPDYLFFSLVAITGSYVVRSSHSEVPFITWKLVDIHIMDHSIPLKLAEPFDYD